MPGSSRIRDNFEDLIFGVPKGGRHLQIPQNRIADGNFQRIIRYTTALFCKQNYDLLNLLGYEYDDVYSIMLMRGCRFLASGHPLRFLSRHLAQRFSRIKSLLERKHRLTEAIEVPTGTACEEMQKADIAEASDDVQTMREELADIQGKIERLVKGRRRNKRKVTRQECESARLEYTAIKFDIRSAKRDLRQHKRLQETLTVDMRGRLAQMPIEQVREIVCRYATLRCVSTEVRKAAQKYCRARGWNYVGWAKQYLRDHDTCSREEFVL